MKLVTLNLRDSLRAGAVLGDRVVDLQLAGEALGVGSLPASVRAILVEGEPALERVRRTLLVVEARLNEAAAGNLPLPGWAVPAEPAEWAPPIPDPEKIVCIGQNYADHCREQNLEPPKFPIIFAKFPTTLAGPRSPVILPPSDLASQIDYEVELAFVFGREARRVRREEAMQYVAGYMVMNDVTARDVQKRDGQWVRGKSFDTFGPCGPWLLTRDEIPDPGNLAIRLRLNGQTMQESSTSNLIFDIPYLIEYLSRGMTFRPGDIITTGTPPGVGIHRKPPVILKAGDVMEAEIEGIGTIVNFCAGA